MRPEAPYMPIVTAGLLSVCESAGLPARAYWSGTLRIEVEADADGLASNIAAARLPDVDSIRWPGSREQAVKSSLKPASEPLAAYRELVSAAAGSERLLLRGLVTDQSVDDGGMPVRSRLLRGVKSDLSVFRDLVKVEPAAMADELRLGPRFKPGKSGRSLGLVPEVQTFGGAVGRKPEAVGAESPMLALLLRHGVLALPPNGAARGRRRTVGGPLISDGAVLSWPQWTIPCDLRMLRAVYSFAEVHRDQPPREVLRARGIEAVFRSAPQQLSTTVAVFRWGERVA